MDQRCELFRGMDPLPDWGMLTGASMQGTSLKTIALEKNYFIWNATWHWVGQEASCHRCLKQQQKARLINRDSELEVKEPWETSFKELSSARGTTASLGFQTTDFSLTRKCCI